MKLEFGLNGQKAPARELSVNAGQDGSVQATVTVDGNFLASSKGGGFGITAWNSDGSESVDYGPFTGLGNARASRDGPSRWQTELIGGDPEQALVPMPELATYSDVQTIIKTEPGGGAEAKTRVWEVRRQKMADLVADVMSHFGGVVSVNPFSEEHSIWTVELTGDADSDDPPVSTLGKTLREFIGEILGPRGWFVRYDRFGRPMLSQHLRGDPVWPFPVTEAVEQIDWDAPSAIIVEGATLHLDTLTGAYVETPELTGDPDTEQIVFPIPGLTLEGDPGNTWATINVTGADLRFTHWEVNVSTDEGDDRLYAISLSQITLGGLPPGESVTVKVRQRTTRGERSISSAWSNAVQFETLPLSVWEPGAAVIESLRGSQSAVDEVNLSWGVLSQYVPAGFLVTRTPPLPQEGEAVTVGGGTTSWTDKEVTPELLGTVVTYSVRAFDAEGNESAPVTLAVDLRIGPPTAVENLEVIAASRKLSLNFDRPARATAYHVLIRMGEETVWEQQDVKEPPLAPAEDDVPQPLPPEVTLSVTPTGLLGGASYTVYVYPLGKPIAGSQMPFSRGEPGEAEFVWPETFGNYIARDGIRAWTDVKTVENASTSYKMPTHHRIERVNGKTVRTYALTTVQGQLFSGLNSRGDAVTVSYTGRVSELEISYKYGYKREEGSRLAREVEERPTETRTVTRTWGPLLDTEDPALASRETLNSLEVTTETWKHSPLSGYLMSYSKVTTPDPSSRILAGTMTHQEEHSALEGGCWNHLTIRTAEVRRLAKRSPLDEYDNLIPLPTPVVESSSEEDGNAPDRLPWVDDTSPGLLVDEQAEFAVKIVESEDPDGQEIAPDDTIEVPLTYRLDLGGKGDPITYKADWLWSTESMQKAAQEIAAVSGPRTRYTRTYRHPIVVSHGDLGVRTWSLRASQGTVEITVTTEQ